MLLLHLQDADLNVKRLKMSVLAEIVLSGDGQEGFVFSCVTRGTLTSGVNDLSVSCAQIPA